jgi:hypothetical protein
MGLRHLLLLGTVVAATPICAAAAASLGLGTSAALGSGGAPVARCDDNGVAVAYTTVGGNVVSVTVSGIADPGCEGAALSLQILNSSGTSIASGSATVAADGDAADNSESVTVSPRPAAEAPTVVHVSLVGP